MTKTGENRIGWSLALALVSTALLAACPPAQEARPVAPPPTPAPAPAAEPPSFPESADEGEITLMPGFTPSPYVIVGATRAARAASEFNAPCPLFIAGPPEYIVDAPEGHRALTMLVQSAAPVGLMVMSPAGDFLCSEGATGVLQNQFPPGRYAIWVGATMEGDDFFYRLGFSEDATVTPAALPESVMGKWEGEGEPVTLAPGFDPDPHVVQGTTRGALSADELEMRCNGFLPDRPNHVLQLTADFPRLRVMVRHNRDTALIITNTRGQVWCEDDVDGRFPIIDDAFPSGHYRIFVATKHEGGTANYSLGFSVSDATTVRSLPRAVAPAAP